MIAAKHESGSENFKVMEREEAKKRVRELGEEVSCTCILKCHSKGGGFSCQHILFYCSED
jgi:hypothetical protein